MSPLAGFSGPCGPFGAHAKSTLSGGFAPARPTPGDPRGLLAAGRLPASGPSHPSQPCSRVPEESHLHLPGACWETLGPAGGLGGVLPRRRLWGELTQ